ncbi:hypothetical protein CR513_19724, partial [Mucuna pruriens]
MGTLRRKSIWRSSYDMKLLPILFRGTPIYLNLKLGNVDDNTMLNKEMCQHLALNTLIRSASKELKSHPKDPLSKGLRCHLKNSSSKRPSVIQKTHHPKGPSVVKRA